ncbi:helix-turn-helix domain-containing protein [Micromonospora zamorensis]|uniref:helix-turn-helix domain-containing protein n=1 Tax=Micromonospora zamorensis TaxID=709883 RepID=UPI003CEEC19B
MDSIEDWLIRPGGLAGHLRGLRRNAGLTGAQTARQLGWAPSKVSKIETGKQMPTDDDLFRWMDMCQASAVAQATLKTDRAVHSIAPGTNDLVHGCESLSIDDRCWHHGWCCDHDESSDDRSVPAGDSGPGRGAGTAVAGPPP